MIRDLLRGVPRGRRVSTREKWRKLAFGFPPIGAPTAQTWRNIIFGGRGLLRIKAELAQGRDRTADL
jgi:hypothetical protein